MADITSSDYETYQVETYKVFNDIVHGIMKIPLYILYIVDTKEFQRLRYITQMGFKICVYPSANHSRFEHSIGTFHLASKLIKKLRKQTKIEKLDLEITDDDVKCVEIAALCHDLGHGPYSHMWDKNVVLRFVEEKDRKSHERLSVEILRNILDNKQYQLKDKINLKEEMIDQICRLILGTPDEEKDQGKRFLFEIVANKISGLDVDKFDYLSRDFIYLGYSNKNLIHDIKRLMHFMRIVKNENKEWCLAMRDKEIFHVHNLFLNRHLLHRYANEHRTVKAIQCMFRDAIENIIENEQLLRELISNVMGKDVQVVSKGDLCSMEFIKRSADHFVWSMICKYSHEIVDRVEMRQLYILYCSLVKKTNGTEKDLSEMTAITKDLENNLSQEVDFIRLSLSTFKLGSEKGNPLFQVPFYQKYKPDKTFNYTTESLPNMVGMINEETQIQIYLTRKINGEQTQIDLILKTWCKTHNFKRENYRIYDCQS